jgi:uncharacterized protein
MDTLAEKIRRKLYDPVYFFLRLYAGFRRLEKNTDNGYKKSILGWGGSFLKHIYGPILRNLTDLRPPGASFPWFSNAEAVAATVQRNRLLNELSGRVHIDAAGSKIYSHLLSPGCIICRDGAWDCNLINRKCTRNCFFCKRYHSVSSELDSTSERYVFSTPDEHLDYIRIFKIKGVGFSGGEPLLVKERLLSHIRAIRKEFGRAIYLWIYTNGDLADRTALSELKNAGLDEIRFNLSARGYDLTPLIISREYIPQVTVEIPAIPEDMELVKGLLIDMESIGVDFLNLHQLNVENQNCRPLFARNYHIDFSTGMGIYESELTALTLILFACDRRLRLPINYCSNAYKARFQTRGFRMRKANVLHENFQEITEAGFIRTLWVSASRENIQKFIGRMSDKDCNPALWKSNETLTATAFHSSLLPFIDWSTSRLMVTYHEPGFSFKKRAGGLTPANLKPNLHLVKSVAGLGKESFETGYAPYIVKKSDRQNTPQIREISEFEELLSGLPDIC